MNQKSMKKLKIAAIVLGVVFLISVIVGLIVVNNNRSSGVSKTAKKKIQKIFAEEDAKNSQKVVSKYGYSIRYDKSIFTGEGHVLNKDSNEKQYSATTYADDELKESRAYAILKLNFKKSSEKSKDDEKFSFTKIMPEFSIVTSRKSNYFDRSTMPEEYKDTKKYSDLDLMLQGDINKLKKNDPNAKYHTSDVEISGLKFKKLVVDYGSTIDGSWRKTGEKISYLTVQNNRPYWISVFALSKNSYMQPYIDQMESLVSRVTFQKPDNSYFIATSQDNFSTSTASATIAKSETKSDTKAENFSEDKDTTNTLDELDEDSVIKVVARNQIATVRVGTFRCADMIYTAQNGASMQLNGLCTGGIGSGSIVSDDGYIATNGHVTEVSNQSMIRGVRTEDHWNRYLRFVMDAGYVTRDTLRDLVNKARNGDQGAQAAIMGFIDQVPDSSIRSQNDRYDYVIQTSSEPIARDDDGSGDMKWKKTKTNIPAKKIDAEVDLRGRGLDLKSDKSDVAILKVEGRFPAVDLGDSSKISKGDRITAIGYPAIVDGGTNTKKSKTVPTVTQGDVSGSTSDAGGHKLFSMSTQIAAGNSGGPAFDNNGKQVGLNTYGGSACANSGKSNNSCFGRGIFRDIADLKTMAKKNNVTLSASGELTKLWKDGLNDFSQGKYSQAKAKFEQLDSKYPGNYLVAKMIEVASNTPDETTESESPGDKPSVSESKDDTIVVIVVVAILSTGVLFVTVSIIAIAVSLRNRRKMNTYPYPVTGQYPQQSQYPQQPYQQPVLTQQQYPQQNYYQQQPGQYPPTYAQPPIEQPPANYPPAAPAQSDNESKNPPAQS